MVKKLLLLGVYLMLSVQSFASDTIVLSTHLTEGRYDYKVTYAVMSEAFKRNGYTLKMLSSPGLRALKMAESGKTDGDAHRVYDLIEKKGLKNLIRVPEVQQTVHDYAWSKKNVQLANGWKGLAPYTVGVHLGTVFVVEKAQEYAKGVSPVNNTEQMFRMLQSNRVDLVIATPANAEVLKTEKFQSSQIKRIEPPLTSLKIYTYLHKKHEALVPKVAEALRSMKADGVYQKLIDGIN